MAAARSVVVGDDGSPSAATAVDWAAERARRLRLPLEVVHAVTVWPYDVRRSADHPADPRADGREVVDATVRRLPTDLDVTTVVDVSSPAALLLDRAATASCVVLGARGGGGFPRLHLGSTAGQVAAHAPCPVVVVREASGRGVVVGVDGSAASRSAVAFAFDEADALGEPLTAVHAWLPVYAGLGDLPYYDDVRPSGDEEESLLAEALAGLQERHPGVEVHRSVVSLHPVPALLEASDGARLLVVGSHGRGGLERLLLGSVSRTLLHHAGCSVAVVRDVATR